MNNNNDKVVFFKNYELHSNENIPRGWFVDRDIHSNFFFVDNNSREEKFEPYYSLQESFYGSIEELIKNLDSVHSALFFKGRAFIDVKGVGKSGLLPSATEELFKELLDLDLDESVSLLNMPYSRFWRAVVKGAIFEKLVLQELRVNLPEFFYFDIKRVHVNRSVVGQLIFEIDFIFVVRSLLGNDLKYKLGEQIAKAMVDMECSNPPISEFRLLRGVGEAVECWKELLHPVFNKIEGFPSGLNYTARYQGWHWFRNYRNNEDYSSVSGGYYFLLEMIDTCLEFRYQFMPFIYSSYPSEVALNRVDEDPRMDDLHRLIPGVFNVESTYDSPMVLFNLIRVYCRMENIGFFNGLFYKSVKESFIKPLGSVEWFRVNINSVLCYINNKFSPTLKVVDVPLLLVKQLDNVIKLLELKLSSSLLIKGGGASAFEEPGNFIAEYRKVKRPKVERSELLFSFA